MQKETNIKEMVKRLEALCIELTEAVEYLEHKRNTQVSIYDIRETVRRVKHAEDKRSGRDR